MTKEIEDYLKIIYQDIENIDAETHKKYEKDKAFLEKFLSQYKEMCEMYKDARESEGDKSFYRTILDMCQRKHDPETKIVAFAGAMLEALETNEIFCEKFDMLMSVIRFGRQEMEKYSSIPLDNTSIELEKVYDLTEEFLEKIDSSGKLLEEFKKLKESGNIEIKEKSSEEESYYDSSNKKIIYVFDGTVNSAHTLVHEFMHHITCKEAQTNMGYYEFTVFREYLSIYYENAFIQFMDEKGLLHNGMEPVIADRMKGEKERDPDNCLSMYLELASKTRKKKEIGKEEIIEIAQKYFPEFQDEEKLWNVASSKLEAFSDEHFFGLEVGAALTLYRFGNALANASNLDETTVRGMHLLAGNVQNGKHDIKMLESVLGVMEITEAELIAKMETEDTNPKPKVFVGEIAQRIDECATLKGKNYITGLFANWGEKEQNKGGEIGNG